MNSLPSSVVTRFAGKLLVLWSLAGTVCVPAQAAAPELVCEVAYASDTQQIRQRVSPDPYAAQVRTVAERFQFKAVVLGSPERIESITLTVYDLSVESGPVVIHQARHATPFNMQTAVPALTGWNHVYSSVYGRELRYGCALQPVPSAPANEAQP